MVLKAGFVCSGIGVPEKIATELNWEITYSSEIDYYASQTLKKNFPHTPNLGDMSKINGFDNPIDLLMGGTPCQDFSIETSNSHQKNGRKGLTGKRSSLALEYIRIARESRPVWIVWENVCGCFSTNNGKDFRYFVNELTNIGYCVGWRILDAKTFGHPMRRPRVFLVGYLGNWKPSKWVLFGENRVTRNLETNVQENRSNTVESITDFIDLLSLETLEKTVVCSRQRSFDNGSVNITPTLTAGKPCFILTKDVARYLTPTEYLRCFGLPDDWIDFKDIPKLKQYHLIGNSIAVRPMEYVFKRINAMQEVLELV